VWDWAPGEDFVTRTAAALESTDRLLAVCTEAYFASAFGGAELRAAFAGHPAAEGRIVPVLIEPVALPLLYAPLIALDPTGLDEATAAARLRSRLAGLRPTGPPPFPRPAPAPTGVEAGVRRPQLEPAGALGEDTLRRCRRVLGPDHLITTLAAAVLTLALFGLGKVEPARARGEDTLPRCRRVLGPDQPITRYIAQAASGHFPVWGRCS
jgi:hypothetical protein